MRLVLVEWVDSYGCSPSWTEIAEPLAPKMLACRSVGWLAHDGADCKVLIPHVADAEGARQGCGDMTIPVRAIVSIRDLTPP